MTLRPPFLFLLFAMLAAGARGETGGTSTAPGRVGDTAEVRSGVGNAAREKPAPPSASLVEYESHLTVLIPVVEQCAASRTVDGCDPGRVGADESVEVPGVGTCEAHYEWLRNLIEKAQQPDERPEAAKVGAAVVENAPPVVARMPVDAVESQETERKTTSALLKEAVARLKHDLAEAQQLGAVAQNRHEREHETLRQVLSQGIYAGLGEEPSRNRALEKLGEWVNDFFDGMNRAALSMPWLGRAVMILFFVVVGALLIWVMLQNQRRLRLRLTPDGFGVVAGAPSARGWELWWRDAQSAAEREQWRDAIHFLYWAAISRMESMRLWPADKARTPREYLGLLKAEDARRAGLLALTRSFERTWYGGRVADEQSYRSAMRLALELMDAGGKR